MRGFFFKKGSENGIGSSCFQGGYDEIRWDYLGLAIGI